MNLRWLIFDYADPALPLSFWRRLRIGLRPFPDEKVDGRRAAVRFAFSVASVVPVILCSQFLRSRLSTAGWFLALAGVLILGWVWCALLYGLLCRREHLYRIRKEGFDVCHNCGYWLRGLALDTPNCPECGEERLSKPIDPETLEQCGTSEEPFSLTMRKIVTLPKPIDGVRRLMTHSCGDGVYLFLFDSDEDGPCTADELYEKIELAESAARVRFGVGVEQWSTIDDPLPGAQQDWIHPTRVKRDADGQKLVGQFEPISPPE